MKKETRELIEMLTRHHADHIEYPDMATCVSDRCRLAAAVVEMDGKAARIDAIDEDRSGVESQEQAWVAHCDRNGWAPDRHTSAKDQFCEGYVSGWAMDKSHIGDDREEMGTQLSAAREGTAKAEAERDRARGVARKYHEWLERVEQVKAAGGNYMGLDHKIGEHADGCDGCAALADADEGE